MQRGCGTYTVGGVQDLTGHDPEQADLISSALSGVLNYRTSGGPFQPGVLCDSVTILLAKLEKLGSNRTEVIQPAVILFYVTLYAR